MAHFAGQPSAAIQVMGNAPEPVDAAWKTYIGRLGLGSLDEGKPTRTSGDAPSFAGIVEHFSDHGEGTELMIRLEEPCPGVAHLVRFPMGGQVLVWIRFYLYGQDAAKTAERIEPEWAAWMAKHFPMSFGVEEPS
jgi:hypothetical protein